MSVCCFFGFLILDSFLNWFFNYSSVFMIIRVFLFVYIWNNIKLSVFIFNRLFSRKVLINFKLFLLQVPGNFFIKLI